MPGRDYRGQVNRLRIERQANEKSFDDPCRVIVFGFTNLCCGRCKYEFSGDDRSVYSLCGGRGRRSCNAQRKSSRPNLHHREWQPYFVRYAFSTPRTKRCGFGEWEQIPGHRHHTVQLRGRCGSVLGFSPMFARLHPIVPHAHVASIWPRNGSTALEQVRSGPETENKVTARRKRIPKYTRKVALVSQGHAGNRCISTR
jgi:hypothetical protein